MQIETTTTIEELIDAGKNIEMTYYNYSYIEKIGNIEYSIYNVLYDYMDEIEPYLQTVILSDIEYRKYKYKPKLLAYDLYGSTDLYFIIMIFNNICNVKDFNMRKIKLLSRANLSIINKIFIAEKSYLDKNRYLLNSKNDNQYKPTSIIKTDDIKKIDIYAFPFNINDYPEHSLSKFINDFFNDRHKISVSRFTEFDFKDILIFDENKPGNVAACAVPAGLNEYVIRYSETIIDRGNSIDIPVELNGEYIIYKLFIYGMPM